MASTGPTDRRVALRALLAGLALLACSLLLARGGAALIAGWVGQARMEQLSEGRGRLTAFLAALPKIAGDDTPDVLVVGSSLVQHGFSPDAFDEALRERGVAATSYNVGFPGVNGAVQHALARRIRDAYAAAGRQPLAVAFEFTPFQATKARRRAPELAELALAKESLLTTPEELAQGWLTGPGRASRLAALRALEGIPAMSNAAALEQLLAPEPPSERELLIERLQALNRRRFPEEPWSARTRGEPRWVFEDTAPLYAQWRQLRSQEEVLRADLAWRVETTDLLQLDFDEGLVAEVISAARALRAACARTYVVVAPRNPAWVALSPEARARLGAVLERISREAGVEVIDLGDTQALSPADFLDTTHLAEGHGRTTFSRLLAAELAARLAPAPAPPPLSAPR